MLEPRVHNERDAILFRYPREFSWIVSPFVLVTVIALAAAAATGWLALIGVPVLLFALATEIAVLRGKAWVDRRGAHIRLYRTRTIPAAEIDNLYIRHVSDGDRHAESIAVSQKNGTQVVLEATTRRCDADGSPRLETALQQAQQFLGLPTELVRRPATPRRAWQVILRRDVTS